MQGGRNVPDNHVADETAQHEDGEMAQEGRRRIGADQPEQHGANPENDGHLANGHRFAATVSVRRFLDHDRRGRWFCRRCRRNLGRWRWPSDLAVLYYGQPSDRVILHVDVDLAILGFAQLFGQA